jgi:mannose-6-phosphate isomerase-like protein (cupin superfamily)
MKIVAIGLTAGILLVSSARQTGSPSGGGFVLDPRDGEALSVRNGEVVIKIDPRTGSARLAMGTQTLRPGAGIGVHLHEQEDEILFVHSGRGIGVLGDDHAAVEPGSTIYIPHGVWHGVENPDGELGLVWVVSPPGLESYFRDSGSPPGAPPKVLTDEQLEDIRRKHGLQSKPK